MNVIDEFFPTKKLCGDLKPPLFRRISRRYITDFRCLSKNDQNVINYDTVDDIPMYQDKKCKCKGINLFDDSKNEVSTGFLVNKGFRHLVTKAIQNFSRYRSTSVD